MARISRTGSGWRPAIAGVMLVALALAGCGEDPNAPPNSGVVPNDSLQVADFSLPDVNPNSASHSQMVGPRLYLNQVSAWYFGHAT